jgi:hypothetical protein
VPLFRHDNDGDDCRVGQSQVRDFIDRITGENGWGHMTTPFTLRLLDLQTPSGCSNKYLVFFVNTSFFYLNLHLSTLGILNESFWTSLSYLYFQS